MEEQGKKAHGYRTSRIPFEIWVSSCHSWETLGVKVTRDLKMTQGDIRRHEATRISRKMIPIRWHSQGASSMVNARSTISSFVRLVGIHIHLVTIRPNVTELPILGQSLG